MAIIFPEHCRGKGITTGTLQQLKMTGASASGGIFSTEYVKHLTQAGHSNYLSNREPLGKYMTALEQANNDAAEMSSALQKQVLMMVSLAEESNKKLADLTGKMRHGSETFGVAIAKMSSIAGNAKFAEITANAESLVNSLERVAELQKSGLLDSVIKAMTAAK